MLVIDLQEISTWLGIVEVGMNEDPRKLTPEEIWLDQNWKPVWSEEYKTRMNKYLGILPVVVWHV